MGKVRISDFAAKPIPGKHANQNDLGKRTTKDLFGEQLHQYVITDAIRDQNVLKFSVEYWGKLKKKDGSLIDEKVAGIDTKEFFESEDRTNGIVDWVIQNHSRKTHSKDFTAMMAVSSVDVLIQYYEQFKAKRLAGEHDLRIATIFSYGVNEDDQDADGIIGEATFTIDDRDPSPEHKHTREKLDEFIADYNEVYGTGFKTKQKDGFYNYYKDIAKRVKARDKPNFKDKDRIDIVLVVNMFLTGFDAKKVNTLYVDKNLRYHGLIQAYSRTNRILGDLKSQGNIICFRNLKANTDEAIALFSDKDAQETILIDPYETYADEFNEGVKILLSITPTVASVDKLKDEEEELKFIKAFRNLMRILNVLKSFSEFTWGDLYMDHQTFEDFKSKYLDLYDKARAADGGEEKVSIIDDVDFELELIQRDEINVAYILALLAQMKDAEQSDDEEERKSAKRRKQSILDLLGSEVQLRSKRDLIERFIDDYMPNIKSSKDVEREFEGFWTAARQQQLDALCVDEGLDSDAVSKIIADYHFSQQTPLRSSIVSALNEKPKILERKSIVDRVTQKIMDIIKTFDDDIGEV